MGSQGQILTVVYRIRLVVDPMPILLDAETMRYWYLHFAKESVIFVYLTDQEQLIRNSRVCYHQLIGVRALRMNWYGPCRSILYECTTLTVSDPTEAHDRIP